MYFLQKAPAAVVSPGLSDDDKAKRIRSMFTPSFTGQNRGVDIIRRPSSGNSQVNGMYSMYQCVLYVSHNSSGTSYRSPCMCIFLHMKMLIHIPSRTGMIWRYWSRVPTAQGKQGKLWKVIPDRENTGNLKILEKHRENTGNLKISEWFWRVTAICIHAPRVATRRSRLMFWR